MFDQEYQKERYKNKEQIFQQLVIGVYEMKQKNGNQLMDKQRQLLEHINISNKQKQFNNIKLVDYSIFKYCRNLTLQIQLQLFIHFHSKQLPKTSSSSPSILLTKQYKTLLKQLISNLKDQQNYELRYKILTNTITAEQLKSIKEIELFNQMKRQQIKEKQRKLLMEFSTQGMGGRVDENHGENYRKQSKQYIVDSIFNNNSNNVNKNTNTSHNNNNNTNKPTYSQQKYPLFSPQELPELALKQSTSFYSKHVDQSTISLLDQLLSKDHLYKMRQRLEQDLKGQIKDKIVNLFLEEFIYQM